MRGQLQLSRALVAALEARPRCAGLDAAQADWDGRPGPLWRKRLTRHTRSCPVCLGAAGILVAPEKLLAGYLLLAVPLALTSCVLAKVTLGKAALGKVALGAATPAPSTALAAGKTGVVSHILQAVAGHPVAVAVVTGAVITGAAVTTTGWPAPHPPPPDVTVVPVPVPVASTVPPTRVTSRPTTSSRPRTTTRAPAVRRTVRSLVAGPVSLESANERGYFLSTTQNFAVLARTAPTSKRTARQQATFEAVRGRGDPSCFSFRLPDGQFLRHSMWRLRVSPDDGSPLFRGDSTFCVRPGSDRESVALESFNYPGYFMHRRGQEIWVDQSDGRHQFDRDTSFRIADPLAH
jgi:hypothetical protein